MGSQQSTHYDRGAFDQWSHAMMKKGGNVDMFSVRCANCALRKLERSSKEKVASLMMYFHRRSRASGLARKLDGLEAVPFPLTQHHIADALGLSLVHVNRTLRGLRAMGCTRTGTAGWCFRIRRRSSAWRRTTAHR